MVAISTKKYILRRSKSQFTRLPVALGLRPCADLERTQYRIDWTPCDVGASLRP